MKKNITLLLILVCLIPQNLQAQKNDAAIAAGVGALATIAVGVASIEKMKEQVELRATEHILNKYPDLNRFLLTTLDFDGKKLTDMSSVSVITFVLREFDVLKHVRKDEVIFKNKMVLFAFTSKGWINENGVNFNKIMWHLVTVDEWLNMMTAYSKLASGEEDEVLIKKALQEGAIVKKGIRANKSEYDINFYRIEGDMYLVSDYSDKFKFVYNERSFGIYLKETKDLVQIGKMELARIHQHLLYEE
jgi:hypothetical protein